MKKNFLTRLEDDTPLLLDGGLATQLEAQGCEIRDALWSAGLLLHDREAIIEAHESYIDAGAECIATASYQASREGFGQKGISATDADDLMRVSVELARDAAGASDVLIAASLGPYGAILHDGSEYRGKYGVERPVLREFHAQRLAVFDSTDADVIALETIPDIDEAEVLAELLKEVATPSWVSFSCPDGATISDGTPIERAAELFRDHPSVCAVGINCTPPQFAAELMTRMSAVLPGMPLLAYPNSGEDYDPDSGTWSGTVTPGDCAAAAANWIEAGAAIVGGCCRMGPEHIRAMRERIG